MNTSMRPAFSRILALALLLSSLAGAWLFVARPLIERYADYDVRIERAVDMIARYQRLGASRTALAARMEQLRNRQPTTEGFLKGDNDALVGAELQNRLKGIVQASGGKLKSFQVLAGKSENGFRRITIRAQISGDIKAVQKIFYAVETSPPMLLVENIDIRARPVRRRNKQKSIDPVITLNVRFDLSGFMQGVDS